MSSLPQGALQQAVADRMRALGALKPEGGVATEPDLAALVVVKDVNLPAFVRGAIQFAADLDDELAGAWQRGFTRTVFLAGDPERIRERYRPDHLSAGCAFGWFVPEAPSGRQGLRRLLKLFEAPEMPATQPGTIAVGGDAGAARWLLYVDTAGVGMDRYLVHVHHLLCEATLRGTLGREDELEVRHVEGIGAAAGPFAHMRVAPEAGDETRLRLYAALAEGPR